MYNIVTIKTDQGEITQLCNQGFVMVCPFKTAQANMQPVMNKTLQGVKPEMQFKGYITQPCDNTCPLFEYNAEKNLVVTYCGCTLRSYKLDPPAEEKKGEQPGTGLHLLP